MVWKAMGMGDGRRVHWRKSADLYSGAAGLALFFLELHRQTGREAYREAAVEGMRWAVRHCQRNPAQDYAFFTGRMGVAYALKRMFDATRDASYLEQAVRVARPCVTLLQTRPAVDDLMGGTAGALLGLIHLHAAVGERWVLEAMDAFVKRLLDRAHLGPRGLYWGRSPTHIRGLCGFSHGASSVGFVFLELGRYLQNESFYWLAEQAFAYESHFYDAAQRNWPDFRTGMRLPDDLTPQTAAYLNGNVDSLVKARDMNAWCHGAAGIGLARLRAYELTKKPEYRDEAKAAIEKTQATACAADRPPATFTLCHGHGGLAALFLEGYRVLGDEEYALLAEIVARKGLDHRQTNKGYTSGYGNLATGEDASLFNGIAGIGYFYLGLLAPMKVPPILGPKVDAVANGQTALQGCSYLTLSRAQARRILIEKVFKRTLVVLSECLPDATPPYCAEAEVESQTVASPKDSFIKFMGRIAGPRRQGKLRGLTEVWGMELEKVRMDDAVDSHALLYIKEHAAMERAKELAALDTDPFDRLKLTWCSGMTIKSTRWRWPIVAPSEWAKNLACPPQEHAVLLRPTALGVMEEWLPAYSHAVLMPFQKGARVENVVNRTLRMFGTVSEEQREIIRQHAVQQIKAALLSGVLIEQPAEG